MATQPVLNSTSLPHPSGYSEQTFLKGAVRRMASGALVRDLITSNVKRRFTLQWQALSSTDKGTVETGLGHVKDGTSRSFTAPSGTSYTVVLAEDGEPDWEIVIAAGGVLRYSGAMVLEEV